MDYLLFLAFALLLGTAVSIILILQYDRREIPIKIKFLHPDAKLPKPALPDDAGDDVYAVSFTRIGDDIIEYDTGIAIEVTDPHYYIEVRPRSSISKYDLVLANGVATIDNGYRGSIKLRFRITKKDSPIIYSVGDKIGQFILARRYTRTYEIADKLSETNRNNGGFGSTGKWLKI